MFLWWGPELTQIFNDGYLPSFGTTGRDLTALGAAGREHWGEIWPVIGPQIEDVMTTGAATWHVDHLVPIERNGRLEDVWWTYGYSPVRDDDGEIAGVLVVVQETTQRVLLERQLRQNEERLVELFRHAPAFICVLRGPDHIYEMTNDAYQRLVGFREVIGLPLREALPEADDQGFTAHLDHVLATGERFVGTELPIVLRDRDGTAEEHFLTFVYQAITEPDGSRSGVFVHGVDVTASVRARADVERANRAKGEFLAVMSHELRTPLNAIGGYAELIEMGLHGPLTEKQRESIARIQQSQRHLLGLINQVLNYTRIETGTMHYAISDIVVAEALAAAAGLIAPQMRQRGIRFDTSATDTEWWMRGDPEKVQQILLNLLTNASKFTEPGGHVTLSAEVADEWVTASVTDTGIGINPDKLPTIFDPFVQVDSLLTRTREGVGLGLAISRDLARGMGGDLTVTSTPGIGSRFSLRLPRVTAQSRGTM